MIIIIILSNVYFFISVFFSLEYKFCEGRDCVYCVCFCFVFLRSLVYIRYLKNLLNFEKVCIWRRMGLLEEIF